MISRYRSSRCSE